MTPNPAVNSGGFSLERVEQLHLAIAAAPADGRVASTLSASIDGLCQEAHERGHPAEDLIVAVKGAWRATARSPHIPVEVWHTLYRNLLTRALAIYFNDGCT
jgi:hypothetical protein